MFWTRILRYFEDGFKIDKTLAQCEDHGGREYSGASRGRWHEGEEGFKLRPLGNHKFKQLTEINDVKKNI